MSEAEHAKALIDRLRSRIPGKACRNNGCICSACNDRRNAAAAIEALEKENALLRNEIEELRHEHADWQYDMLVKFDPAAAGSTDLFTWIRCKLAKLERAEAALIEADKNHLED